MTLDVYTDLFEVDLDEVAQRLDEAALRSSVVNMWSNGPAEVPIGATGAARIRRFRACGADGT